MPPSEVRTVAIRNKMEVHIHTRIRSTFSSVPIDMHVKLMSILLNGNS